MLYFLQIDGRSSEVIVSKEGIKSSTLPNEKTSVLQKAAKLIRNDILEFDENCRELIWPPSTQELQKRDRDISRSVISFLEGVLKPPGHSCSDTIQRYIQSYASDLVHEVIQGKLITLKHFLLGFGLHNLTGQKT